MARRRRKRKEKPRDEVGERYGLLCDALLAHGLAAEGFRRAGRTSVLVAESEEVEGGFELRRSKADPYTFSVNVGAWSKRLHRFEVEGTPFKDRFKEFPFVSRSHVGDRLEQFRDREAGQEVPHQWTLEGPEAVEALAARLAPVLLEVGLPFLRAHWTDAAILEAMLARRHERGRQGAEVLRLRKVHLAVLHDALGETDERERLFAEALEGAECAADREEVEEAIQRFRDPVVPALPLEQLPPDEALARLREMTGQDFGDDMAAWTAWLKEHGQA